MFFLRMSRFLQLVFNLFHKHIKLTYLEEQNNALPFLDVFFIRHGETRNTTICRNDTIMICVYTRTRLPQSIGKEGH